MKLFLTLACVLVMINGCAEQKIIGKKEVQQPFSPNMTDVALVWAPEEQVGQYDSINVKLAQPLFIGQITIIDTLANRSIIGQNLQNGPQIRTVSTNQNIAEWCQKNVTTVLGELGISVNAGPQYPKLKCSIKKLIVTEKDEYEGTAKTSFHLISSTGASLYAKTITSTISGWGSSFTLGNYHARLSDAVLISIHKLVMDKDFIKALEANQ